MIQYIYFRSYEYEAHTWSYRDFIHEYMELLCIKNPIWWYNEIIYWNKDED